MSGDGPAIKVDQRFTVYGIEYELTGVDLLELSRIQGEERTVIAWVGNAYHPAEVLDVATSDAVARRGRGARRLFGLFSGLTLALVLAVQPSIAAGGAKGDGCGRSGSEKTGEAPGPAPQVRTDPKTCPCPGPQAPRTTAGVLFQVVSVPARDRIVWGPAADQGRCQVLAALLGPGYRCEEVRDH